MGVVMAPGDLDGVWQTCAFPGFLIALADGRRILVDTGPHRRHITEPMYEFAGSDFANHLIPRMTPADDPVNRLAELGLTLADIDILVATHCHFDHIGNLADFSASEIVIHRDALIAGLDRGKANQPGGIPESAADGTPLNYRVIESDTDLASGLTLIETPGHAPGHLSVFLRLPETGPIILAIDAIYSQTNRDAANYSVAADPTQARASAERLIALAESENALLIYGHDPSQWATLKKAPDQYL
jgi:N-acyl homoserine lactone hydrolase